MKKLLFFIVLLFLFVFFLQKQSNINFSIDNLFTYSFCDEAITYKIDIVDPRFNLSQEKFALRTKEAVMVWNNTAKKELFIEDENGKLSINLIYDERQYLSSKVSQLKEEINSERQSLNPKIDQYEKLSKEFKQKVDELNKEIEFWNNQGGAPAEIFSEIIQKQNNLKLEANNLNEIAQSLKISTNEYNSGVLNLNQTVEVFNNALVERPEEGIYKGEENKIEIYFNTSEKGLVHTLAHELGHALGIEHNNNPESIMYFQTNNSLIPSPEDQESLDEVCKKRSIIEDFQSYLMSIFTKYKSYLAM